MSTVSPVAWTTIGGLDFSNGRLLFPKAPDSPGLYRLKLDDGHVLIGKAGKGLKRRLGEYRRPCQGIEHENVIHLILLNAHDQNVKVEVAVFITSDFNRLEQTEISGAIARRERVLNKHGLGRAHYLAFKVKYYEQMLANAKTELASYHSQSCGDTDSD